MTEDRNVRDVLRWRIAANLRAARERAGLAQPAVAEMMRAEGYPWSQQTVARVEAASRKADLSEIFTLARIYDITANDLERPEGHARAAWLILDAVRRARAAQRELRDGRLLLSNARADLTRLLAQAEEDGTAKELDAEVGLARHTLADTEAGQ